MMFLDEIKFLFASIGYYFIIAIITATILVLAFSSFYAYFRTF